VVLALNGVEAHSRKIPGRGNELDQTPAVIVPQLFWQNKEEQFKLRIDKSWKCSISRSKTPKKESAQIRPIRVLRVLFFPHQLITALPRPH
jgi:hypothetical protein